MARNDALGLVLSTESSWAFSLHSEQCLLAQSAMRKFLVHKQQILKTLIVIGSRLVIVGTKGELVWFDENAKNSTGFVFNTQTLT